MKKRSVAGVVLFPFITFGIYTIYWYVSTKGELNKKGANIPTAWLIIIPLVNIWWMWKYFEGAEQVTDKKVNSIIMFVLAVFITSIISSAVCQNEYNSLSDDLIAKDPVMPSDGSAPVTAGTAETAPTTSMPEQTIVESTAATPVQQDVVASSTPEEQTVASDSSSESNVNS